MKTFSHLIQEVQEKGLCHHCGGCVAFCTAINYGALELGEDGRPRYSNKEKCIECGICYAICPVIGELDEDTKNLVSWSPPMGRVMGTTVARATDPEVRARGTDGGGVTALLVHLFDRGRIDAAIGPQTGGACGDAMPGQYLAAHGGPGGGAFGGHQVPFRPVLRRELPIRPGAA